MNDRGRVHVPDAVMAVAVSVAVLGTAPVYYDLIGTLSSESGPLGSLLLELVVPFMLVGVIISVGVSARRRE